MGGLSGQGEGVGGRVRGRDGGIIVGREGLGRRIAERGWDARTES